MVVRGKHQWHIGYQMIKIVAVVCSPIFLVGMRLFAVQTNMTDWASVTIFQKSHDFDLGLFIIHTRPDAVACVVLPQKNVSTKNRAAENVCNFFD